MQKTIAILISASEIFLWQPPPFLSSPSRLDASQGFKVSGVSTAPLPDFVCSSYSLVVTNYAFNPVLASLFYIQIYGDLADLKKRE